MDMFAMALRGMGIDPDVVMTQAAGIGKAFERLLSGQAVMMAKLDAIESNQLAIMAALGLPLPEPGADIQRLIEAESVRHIAISTGRT